MHVCNYAQSFLCAPALSKENAQGRGNSGCDKDEKIQQLLPDWISD